MIRDLSCFIVLNISFDSIHVQLIFIRKAGSPYMLRNKPAIVKSKSIKNLNRVSENVQSEGKLWKFYDGHLLGRDEFFCERFLAKINH